MQEDKRESNLKCINFTDTSLEVLDQTLLPNEVKYVKIQNITDAWSVIKEMKVRGAPLIAVVALQGLKIDLLNNKEIHNDPNVIKEYLLNSSKYLKTSRPTAVNLSNDLDELINSTKNINDPKSLLEGIFYFIENNFKAYENSSYQMAKWGADLILNDPKFISKSSISILTICNTGKLAMPGIGSALGIIREIHNRNKLNTLYIPETRPYNQGSRLTAFEALYDNLPGVLITDSMAGMLMRNKMVDCVIIGADRVTKLGFTANKIGSYSFAVMAKHHNIPFYVACPKSTIDFNMNNGNEIIIEERPANELRKIYNQFISPKDIEVWNPSFDVTPPNLIEKIITENGEYQFDKNYSEWEELPAKKLESYLKDNLKLVDKNENLTITDVADGNLNHVYRIEGSKNTYCVKQAPPYVKCVGDSWPLDVDRSLFEAEALKYEQEICPNFVPKLLHHNNVLALIVMEFLNEHIILRNGLINGTRYESIGSKLGEFVAKTCFYSSGFHLKPQELRNRMSFWNRNTLCVLTEQVIFSDPYIDSPLNRRTSPYLDEIVKEFRNEDIILPVYKLRHKFILCKQALIHGDLHSGSIMVDSNGSVKVIDPEFSFYGPIGFDTGNVIAHFLMSYFSQRALKNGDENYEEWILEQIITFWNSFHDEFNKVWNLEENRVDEFPGLFNNNPEIFEKIKIAFFQELFLDTIGYTAVEIIRRIFGIAHVADFEKIEDLQLRAEKELLALKIAKMMLKDPEKFKNIENVVEIARQINS